MTSLTELHDQVWAAFSEIALLPGENGLFPCGRPLAEDLGYPAEVLDKLPLAAVEAFCGVGDVSLYADIGPADVVLDTGCGAGLDTIVAAWRSSKVVSIDFSLAMLERAKLSVEQSGLDGKVTLLNAAVEKIPLMAACIDVALVNGLFNLSPFRGQIFLELARVLRPGGRLYVSELILKEPADVSAAGDWFS